MRLLAALILSGPTASAQTTYTKDIARLMQTACQECHQPGKVAPMSLLTYDDVATYSDDIQRVLTDKSMPPWKPIPGYGDFRNSYGITDAQRQMFLDWISNGMPVGDPADAPDPLPVSDSPGSLGRRTLILQPPPPTRLPQRARHIPLFFLGDRIKPSTYIKASQAVPGAAQEVHHVLMVLDPSGDTAALDGADGQPGYDCFGDIGIGNLSSLQQVLGALVGTWVPGAQVNPLDDGIGILIPANARIVMQVHYHPSGTSTPDQTLAGFYFSPPNSVQHRLISLPLVNSRFQDSRQQFELRSGCQAASAVFRMGKSQQILAPHASVGTEDRHQRDRFGWEGDAVDPDRRLGFNWQGTYMYNQPIPVAGNSVLSLTSFYDNSDQN